MSAQDTRRRTRGAAAAGGGTAGENAPDAAAGTASPVDQGGAGSGATNDTASQVAAQLAELLRGNPGALRDILAQAQQSTSQAAGQVAGRVQRQAASGFDAQKANLVGGLGSLAEEIRQMGENLRISEQGGVVQLAAEYGDSAADQIERLSNYLSERDMNELFGEVENFARRNATYFVGGAFLVGLLGARFLKSSSPRQALIVRPRTRETDAALPTPSLPDAGATAGGGTAAPDQTPQPAQVG